MSHTLRRGMALLLALVALSVLSVMGLGTLRTATMMAQQTRCDLLDEQSLLIAHGLEAPLLELARRGGPFRSTEDQPGSRGDRGDRGDWRLVWHGEFDELRVRAECLDLSGRLPVWAAALPDGEGLPSEVRDAVSARAQAGSVADGSVNKSWGSVTLHELVRSAQNQTGTSSAERCEPVREFPEARADPFTTVAPSASDWITVHRSRGLNIRTAPMALLTSSLHGGGVDRTTAQELIDRRAALAGAPANGRLPDELVQRVIAQRQAVLSTSPSLSPPRVPLVGDSNAYGLLITVEQGAMVRRWWLVAEHGSPLRHAPSPRVADGTNSPADDPAELRADERPDWRIVERRRVGP